MLRVRKAVVDDAIGMAHVNVVSWREAYPLLLSPTFLASLSEYDLAQGYRRGLEAGTAAWVAEDETHIVGIATASQPREENPPRALELRTLYLLSAHYGSGAGQGLLDASVGTEPCMLWVASENPRAIAFYHRNGFTLDGAKKIEKQWENMKSARMVR